MKNFQYSGQDLMYLTFILYVRPLVEKKNQDGVKEKSGWGKRKIV